MFWRTFDNSRFSTGIHLQISASCSRFLLSLSRLKCYFCAEHLFWKVLYILCLPKDTWAWANDLLLLLLFSLLLGKVHRSPPITQHKITSVYQSLPLVDLSTCFALPSPYPLRLSHCHPLPFLPPSFNATLSPSSLLVWYVGKAAILCSSRGPCTNLWPA
jgi:hypothetical protein